MALATASSSRFGAQRELQARPKSPGTAMSCGVGVAARRLPWLLAVLLLCMLPAGLPGVRLPVLLGRWQGIARRAAERPGHALLVSCRLLLALLHAARQTDSVLSSRTSDLHPATEPAPEITTERTCCDVDAHSSQL